LIYEDLSFAEHFKKLNEDYFITIKNKKYVVVPKCFIFGKYNTIMYYYNNPFPIGFEYKISKLSSLDFYDDTVIKKLSQQQRDDLSEVVIDAKTIDVAMNSNLVNKMYSEGKMTTFNYILIIGAVLVVVLILLHVFGVIDLMAILGVKT
jgi:hypothetical protein